MLRVSNTELLFVVFIAGADFTLLNCNYCMQAAHHDYADSFPNNKSSFVFATAWRCHALFNAISTRIEAKL
jgi:hypothetical protein